MTSMFDNDYLAQLPRDPLLAANKICTDFFNHSLKEDPADLVLTLTTLLGDNLPKDWSVGVRSGRSALSSILLPMSSASRDAREELYVIHRHVKAQLTVAAIGSPEMMNQYLLVLSESETKRIDELLAEIRDVVRDSPTIKDEQKRRLLKVVNTLQAEVDKQYSDFRVFLDGMVEVSEAVGEAGQNVKPVFDRVREVFGIAQKVQKARDSLEAPEKPELLPPPPKELPSPDE